MFYTNKIPLFLNYTFRNSNAFLALHFCNPIAAMKPKDRTRDWMLHIWALKFSVQELIKNLDVENMEQNFKVKIMNEKLKAKEEICKFQYLDLFQALSQSYSYVYFCLRVSVIFFVLLAPIPEKWYSWIQVGYYFPNFQIGFIWCGCSNWSH